MSLRRTRDDALDLLYVKHHILVRNESTSLFRTETAAKTEQDKKKLTV